MKKIVSGLLAAAILPFLTGCYVSAGYRDGWHRHRRGGWHSATEVQAVVDKHAKHQKQEEIASLSADYNIQYESANKILTMLNSKTLKEDLEDMGLKANDLKPLRDLEMPSQETISKIAASLDESEYAVTRMMIDYIADIKAEDMNTIQ